MLDCLVLRRAAIGAAAFSTVPCTNVKQYFPRPATQACACGALYKYNHMQQHLALNPHSGSHRQALSLILFSFFLDTQNGRYCFTLHLQVERRKILYTAMV